MPGRVAPLRLRGLAHEPLTSSANERYRLGEEDAHRITERDCLLVDAALRLHLLQGRRGQLDRGIERERRELLPLRLLYRLGLLLGELAQSAHQVVGVAPERESEASAFHAARVAAAPRSAAPCGCAAPQR